MTKAPKYFIQIPVNTAKRTDISSTDKLVFGEIHTMLNATKQFFMSSSSLGSKIGKKRNTVIRSIKHLSNAGLIFTKFNPHDPNNHKRYIYDPKDVGSIKNGTTKNKTTGGTKSERGRFKNGATSSTKNGAVIDEQNRQENKSLNISHRDFQKVFNQYKQYFINTNPSVYQAINYWLPKYSTKRILNAMNITKIRCRSTYPNAVIGYIGTILKNNKQNFNKPSHQDNGGDNNESKYDQKITHL